MSGAIYEMSVKELFGYRVHRNLHELHDYKNLRKNVAQHGVLEPVDIVTDGRHCYLEDGHKRLHAAVENSIKTLKVRIFQREISARRRMKYPLGPEMQQILAPTIPVATEDPVSLNED